MLEIIKTVTPDPNWLLAVMEGMRNAFESWDRMDSYITHIEDSQTGMVAPFEFFLGKKDEVLARTLACAGDSHGKFLRQIPVLLDVSAPLYWWKEFDQYKVGTTTNSCSTMHTLHKRDVTIDDFAHKDMDDDSIPALEDAIKAVNEARVKYVNMVSEIKELRSQHPKDEKEKELLDERIFLMRVESKKYWYGMIQLLPSSWMQRRLIALDYAVIRRAYWDRFNHPQKEWADFRHWAEQLPYSFLITEKTISPTVHE